MKQSDIIAAYKAADELCKQKIKSPKVANVFYIVKNLLKPQYDFQVEREKAVFDKYQFTQTEDGLKFETQELADQFAAEYSEEIKQLSEMDVDLDFKKQTVNLSEQFEISGDDIGALSPFINFVEE